jgi:predicted GNAT family N-acyltransferase
MDGFKFVEGPIEVYDYIKLREAAGWPALDYDLAEQALANSLYSVNVVSQTEVVGCGRVVGDGGAYFYIQDVIVLPEFRSLGLGNAIMERIMGYLKTEAKPGAFVGLMASQGLSGFYVKYGFSERDPSGPGMFRIWKEPGQ